jgi:5'-nucleotidase
VVSGINPGANLGVDLFYSGTAAAAREAAILGVPAIALSRLLQVDRPINWEILSRHVTRLVQTMMSDEFQLPGGHFWNVNFPAAAGEKYPEEITFVPQGTEPHAVAYKVVERSENTEFLAYSAVYRERGRSDLSDVHHLFEQRLTATPVGPSLTSDPLQRLHSSVSLVDATCPD